MRTKEMSRLMSSSGVPLVRLLVRKEVKHDHACTTEDACTTEGDALARRNIRCCLKAKIPMMPKPDYTA